MFHKWFGDEQDRPCSCADERQMHRTHCEWGQQMPDILCWRGGKWTKTSKIEVLDSLLS